MASAKLKDEMVEGDILTCAVCLERLEDPVTLTCQHSYCRRCIDSHIQTKARAGQGILCPSCNQPLQVPLPLKPVEEWAGQLKAGIAVQKLLSAWAAQANQESPPSGCSVCKEVGEVTPVVTWCEECEVALCDKCSAMHRVLAVSRDHVLLKPDQRGRLTKPRRIPCNVHEDKIIELHCNDCDKSLCQLCAVVDRRACTSVDTITSMMPKLRGDMSEYSQKMTDRDQDETTMIHIRNTIIAGLETDKIVGKRVIEERTRKMIEGIKLKERGLIEELDNAVDGRIQQLRADVKTSEIQKQTSRQIGDVIDQTLASNCQMDIYNLYQSWKNGCLDIDPLVSIPKDDVESVLVDTTPQNDEMLAALSLGQTKLYHGIGWGEVSFYSPMCGNAESDENHPHLVVGTYLFDADITEDPEVLATDFSNKCIKVMAYGRDEIFHDKLQLEGSPHGIAKLNERQALITVTDPNQIVMYTVLGNPQLSTVDVSEAYYSLTVINPSTLAAVKGDHNLDILNIEGVVLRSIETGADAQMLNAPAYLCVDAYGNLLLSTGFTVTCLTVEEGKVLWIHRVSGEGSDHLLGGIATTESGYIFLVDVSSKKIIQLSKMGKYVRDVVTCGELKDPNGIFIDRYGTLYVCDDSLIKEFSFWCTSL